MSEAKFLASIIRDGEYCSEKCPFFGGDESHVTGECLLFSETIITRFPESLGDGKKNFVACERCQYVVNKITENGSD